MTEDQLEETHAHRAISILQGLRGKQLEALALGRPRSVDHAASLSRIIGKLSPIVSDLLEYEFAAYLNAAGGWPPGSEWVRQEKIFPDLVLRNGKAVLAGIEIKTWSPLAREITGRFRETRAILAGSNTCIMVVAWLPEFLLHGGPRTLDTWVDSAANVAAMRDSKYQRPPRSVVIEYGAANPYGLQPDNCEGYLFDGSEEELAQATAEVASWSRSAALTSQEQQEKLRELMRNYPYRVDANFAKLDRIDQALLRTFKDRVLATRFHGRAIGEWRDRIAAEDGDILREITSLGSTEVTPLR